MDPGAATPVLRGENGPLPRLPAVTPWGHLHAVPGLCQHRLSCDGTKELLYG